MPKPDTCTERYDVNPTGISRKVARITLGDLFGLPRATGTERWRDGEQKSAEAVVVARNRSDEGLNLP